MVGAVALVLVLVSVLVLALELVLILELVLALELVLILELVLVLVLVLALASGTRLLKLAIAGDSIDVIKGKGLSQEVEVYQQPKVDMRG